MEDNELWLRHLLVLVSQVVVAFYAFTRSWWSKDPLLFIVIPIFVAGIIKYGERNWVLRSASTEQYRNLVYSEMNELLSKFEKFSNAEFFEMTDERLGTICRSCSWRFHSFGYTYYPKKKSAMEAFELIEVEMGFMYDVLYTKLAKVRKSRVILRATTFLCLVSALLAFSLGMSKNNHGYLTADITISYLLLYGAIAIEIYSVAVLLFSDWAMLWLTGKRKPLFGSVYRTICSSRFLSFLRNDKRWECRMAQHNLISFQRSKGKLTSISLKRLLGKATFKVRRIHDPGRNDLHEILSERGDEVIGRMKSLENFGWSVKFPDFNESLLAWHIATDICHHDDVRINGGDTETIRLNTEISLGLSNYMVYLLLDCPFLLPRGIGKERYNQTCSAVDDEAELLDRIISGQHDSWYASASTFEIEKNQRKVSALWTGVKL
ncbi:hypothetical protein OIU85_015577, partial [Salix viminalis]